MSEYNLKIVPTDPVRARNYPELMALSDEGRIRLGASEPLSEAETSDWERRICALLTDREREFFLKPYQGTELSGDLAIIGRMDHLRKILLARHGIVTDPRLR
jgi:hypothetical protein